MFLSRCFCKAHWRINSSTRTPSSFIFIQFSRKINGRSRILRSATTNPWGEGMGTVLTQALYLYRLQCEPDHAIRFYGRSTYS